MPTVVFYTSQELEKDRIIMLYVRNAATGKREPKTARVIKKNTHSAVGDCFAYAVKIIN